MIEGIFEKHGEAEAIDLYVYRDDSPVQTMHQRSWTNATDAAIKRKMVEILGEKGVNARVVER